MSALLHVLALTIAQRFTFGAPLLHNPLLMWWLPFFLVPAIIAGFAFRASMGRTLRRAYTALVLATIVAFGGLLAARARQNIVDPPEWDVQAFWLPARVAAAGRNFYDLDDVRRTAAPLQHASPPLSATPVFTREIIETGFLYPPPTMLLVRPIGSFGLRGAAALWYAIIGAALVASVLLLWRTFLAADGWLGLGVIAALVFLWRATYSTIAFAQTSLLLLLALILLWRNRDRPIGGLYLALGMLVKPVFGFFLIYPVVRRHWRALGVCAITLAVLSLAALAAFGRAVWMTYLTANPTQRVANWQYTLDENQSLLATMLRFVQYDFARGSPLRYPPYVVVAGVIVALTAWIVWRARREPNGLALATVVPAALLVYPQSLEHYGTMLLVPMLWVWVERETLGLGERFVLLFLTAEYALMRYDAGSIAVIATVLQWLLFVWLALRAAREQAPVPVSRARATAGASAAPSPGTA
jgi:hypothetical protein